MTDHDLFRNVRVRVERRSRRTACPVCKGEGVTHRDEIVNYHDYQEKTVTETCSSCLGDGLKMRVETTYRLLGANNNVIHVEVGAEPPDIFEDRRLADGE